MEFRTPLAGAISIHAPQWGATDTIFSNCHNYGISIHAPQWGATGRRYQTAYSLLFQSTHPSGVRRAATTLFDGLVQFQSTHPSGVRRSRCSTCFSGRRDFNPRTPVGCDQPDHHAIQHQRDFNPRTPVGCDVTRYQQPTTITEISIHAPQWGATGRIIASFW